MSTEKTLYHDNAQTKSVNFTNGDLSVALSTVSSSPRLRLRYTRALLLANLNVKQDSSLKTTGFHWFLIQLKVSCSPHQSVIVMKGHQYRSIMKSPNLKRSVMEAISDSLCCYSSTKHLHACGNCNKKSDSKMTSSFCHVFRK